jgi:hypothetical protein
MFDLYLRINISNTPMSTQKKLNSTRVSLVIVSLCMLLFLIWSMRQCTDTKEEDNYAMVQETQARQNYLDSIQRAEDSIALFSAVQEEARLRAEALQRAATIPALGDSVIRGKVVERIIEEKVTVLYVTFDGLNVRSGPALKYGKVDRLDLYDEVVFLNEVTDSAFTIDLGEVAPTEPWVKIRTASGKEGWVFGAGVDYFKRKLDGVIN